MAGLTEAEGSRMIGVDTNIMLRLLLRDDAVHTPLAERLLREAERETIHIADLVIAEVAWTLRRQFKWSRHRIVGVLDRLLGQDKFVFANRAAVMNALSSFEVGPADFADYLIGALNAEAGATSTFTFDQDAARHRHFTLVVSASPDAEGSRR